MAQLWYTALGESFEASETEAKESNIRYSFRHAESGMANDALERYSDELTSIFERRGDVIVDSYEKLVQQVRRAFEQPKDKATLYF